MKRIPSVLLLLLLLSGCDREPVYRGLNFVVFNYTQWEMGMVRVRDRDGDGGGAGVLPPGSGEGSLSCCGSLRGTDFVVNWTGIEDEDAVKHMFDGRLHEFIFKKSAKVHFPPTKIPPGDGPLIFQVHIYPDEHIEFALTRDLGGTRIPIVPVGDWMMRNFSKELNPRGDPYKKYSVNREVARIVSNAWTKYRLEDEQDLRQYVYLAMLVNAKFDDLPRFQKVLNDKDRKPGDFARFVKSKPRGIFDDMNQQSAGLKSSHG